MADFYLLVGHFVDTPDSGKSNTKRNVWYKDCTLLFKNDEMRKFADSLRTVAGKPEGKFGFGFNSLEKVVQTRGDGTRSFEDYTSYLLNNRIDLLKREFA